jgi:protein SCO1/2
MFAATRSCPPARRLPTTIVTLIVCEEDAEPLAGVKEGREMVTSDTPSLEPRMNRPFLLLCTLAIAAPAISQEHHHHVMAAPPPAASRTYNIPDVPMRTATGEQVHFYTDLVKGRVVVMNFIFTSCTTICPTMGATFARVQRLLGTRNVAMISVSIDPTVDTPERLAVWSKRLGAKPGWTLVTGEKTDVDRLLKSLGLFNADPAAHSPVVLVGDEKMGRWERIDGLAAPTSIVAVIDRMSGEEKGK